MSAAGERMALVVRIAGDVSAAVPNQLHLLTTYVLVEQETWFEDEIGFLCRTLEPGLRMLDVGANYGMYSLPLARLAGPDGQILSVEPSRETSDYLRASAGLNQLGRMQVIRVALSNRIGTAQLRLETDSELNALVGNTQGGTDATETVLVTTLDALAAEYDCSALDFLKLDAEGEETRIVAGGTAFLRSESPLVMYEIKHGDKLNLQLVAALSALGYASYRLVPGLDILTPFDPEAAIDPFQLNLFACKPDRAARLEVAGRLAQSMRQVDTVGVGSALDCYRQAHDATLLPAARMAALNAADRKLSAACDGETDTYTLSSAARVAWELGERRRALALLSRAEALCNKADPGDPREPFLAPSPAFDTIRSEGRHAAWLTAALLDQFVVLTAYSTRFCGPEILPLLERIKETGFQRAPMERRRQLMRLAAGLQSALEPADCLTATRPDNLNPAIWASVS